MTRSVEVFFLSVYPIAINPYLDFPKRGIITENVVKTQCMREYVLVSNGN